jgi:large subunit ribosomal protein L15
MIQLNGLQNTTRPRKKIQRVGRGPGSGRGKTSCRGHKGDGSRSGYRRRFGYEGGQVPLYKKLPCRGFTRGRFTKTVLLSINLGDIDKLYSDGEIVNFATLREKGVISKSEFGGVKILSKGELSKKVKLEAHSFSKEAASKLEKSKISFKVLN